MTDACIEAGLFIEPWLRSGHLLDAPGAAIGITHKNEEVLSATYGYADIEAKTPFTPEHQFQIASQSKVFTATAIMQLQEKGALLISDPVSKYISEFDQASDTRLSTVTIEQLLSHTGGLSRDGSSADFWELNSPFPTEDMLIQDLMSSQLPFDPGERMKYSNSGYAVLGLVAERVTGVPYDQYISSHILAPLSLGRTSVNSCLSVALSSRGYGVTQEGHRPVLRDLPTNAFAPATGIYSTTRDLLHFYAELSNPSEAGGIVSQASSEEMFRDRVDAPYSGGVKYGLGIDIGMDGSTRVVGHGGGYPGQRSGTIVDRKNEIIVSAFANSIEIDAFTTAIDVARVLRYFLECNESVRPDRAHWNTTLESIWGNRQIVTVGNRVVSVDPTGRNPFAEENLEVLTPIDEDTLRITQASGFGHAGESVDMSQLSSGIVTYGGRRLAARD